MHQLANGFSRAPEHPTLKSPLFLGRFSPKFRPFYAIFGPFSPSWRQEAGNRERTVKRRRKTGEKWPRNSGLKALGYTEPDRQRELGVLCGEGRAQRDVVVIVEDEGLPAAAAMRSEHPELARPAKRCLGALDTVSWPWIPVLGSLEPPRRGGENAQKTGIFGEEMGETRSKKCEGVGITCCTAAHPPTPRCPAG